ncbi:hypothetical protein [Streptomyces spiralis]
MPGPAPGRRHLRRPPTDDESGHGLDLGPEAPKGQALIADVKLATVGAGRAFALAPPKWQ